MGTRVRALVRTWRVVPVATVPGLSPGRRQESRWALVGAAKVWLVCWAPFTPGSLGGAQGACAGGKLHLPLQARLGALL